MSINNIITAPCEDVSFLHGLGNKPSLIGAYLFDMKRTKGPLCACGCGQPVLRVKKSPYNWNKYIHGHSLKGKKFSEEHRNKLSENKKKFYNKPTPISIQCECGCGEMAVPGNKFIRGHNRRGSVFTQKHRKLLSERRKGIPISKEHRSQISKTLSTFYTDKKNHPRWKGGLSYEPYSTDFNSKLKLHIRKLYGFTCQLCDIHENELNEKLSVHHIDYNKQNNQIHNLLPLCRKCHIKTNTNRDYWKSICSQKVLFDETHQE